MQHAKMAIVIAAVTVAFQAALSAAQVIPPPRAPVKPGFSATQKAPLSKSEQKIKSLIEDELPIDARLQVMMDRSKLIRTRVPVSRVSVVDSKVADVVQFGPYEVEVMPRRAGETTVTIWFDGPEPQRVLRYLVTVPKESDSRYPRSSRPR